MFVYIVVYTYIYTTYMFVYVRPMYVRHRVLVCAAVVAITAPARVLCPMYTGRTSILYIDT